MHSNTSKYPQSIITSYEDWYVKKVAPKAAQHFVDRTTSAAQLEVGLIALEAAKKNAGPVPQLGAPRRASHLHIVKLSPSNAQRLGPSNAQRAQRLAAIEAARGDVIAAVGESLPIEAQLLPELRQQMHIERMRTLELEEQLARELRKGSRADLAAADRLWTALVG